MCEDALAGVERLRAEAPSRPLVLVGTRWGALIAAGTAARHADASLVLWEPLLDAARFFKDAFRRQLVRDVRRSVEAPTSGRELEARLRAGEGVDVVSHRLEPAFYRSAASRSLETELGTAPRDVLVVQIASTGAVRSDLGRLASRWEDAGLRVDARALRGDQGSWLNEDRFGDETVHTLTRELIDLTTRWIAGRAGVTDEMGTAQRGTQG
jgi:pimeloyl-ACP methyl ester carboxylesterase